MNKIIEQTKIMVFQLLENDTSGHNIDHIERVYNLALKFSKTEKANIEIISLAALLHDVDDYKIVGKENAEKLTNAKKIMSELKINKDIQLQVLNIIKTMGYSNYLKDIRPITLEGKIVSDADMCDAIGANGIIRSIVYAVSSKGNGIIFDKNIFPNVNITEEEYNSNRTQTTHSTDSAINHFFEKLLKLNNLMLTKSGKKESLKKQKIMINFLRNFFEEENVPEWQKFLEGYLRNQKYKW